MKLKLLIRISTLSLVVVAGAAAAAIPGPQRMLAPGLFGLTEIAPNVFTDDLSKKDSWLDLKSEADKRDAAFFGHLQSRPRYLLCTHATCERTFGEDGGRAVSFGEHLIIIPAKALDGREMGITWLAHERSHAELVHRFGLWASFTAKIPAWFNEGLATYVSRDPRVDPFYSQEERRWIRKSAYWFGWGKFSAERGWRTAYGAAADNVARLDERLGHEGVLKFVEQAAAAQDFTQAIERQLVD